MVRILFFKGCVSASAAPSSAAPPSATHNAGTSAAPVDADAEVSTGKVAMPCAGANYGST